jgi:magnesium transporter
MESTTSSPPSPSDADGGGTGGDDAAVGNGSARREPHVDVVAVDERGIAVQVEGLDALERAAADERLRLWVNLTGDDLPTLQRIGRVLGLHGLIVTNIAESNQRAKVERIDDDLHLVLFALVYEGEVRAFELDFVLGGRFLLTVHDGDWDLQGAPQLRAGVAAVLGRGPDYLLYALSDWIVDGYFPVLDRLTDQIDSLQDDVIDSPTSWTLERLFALKRELISVRRATSPAREMFNQLTNRELGLIQDRHVIYFRDVYDHLVRVAEEVDNYRELVSGTLEVYLTSVNNNLSNIMKRLTGVTAILAGIGAVAGIFGMSEAGLAFSGGEAIGFWIVAGAMLLAALVGAAVLRRINWI